MAESFVDIYRVEWPVGQIFIGHDLTTQVLYQSDPKIITRLVIEQLIYHAQHKMGLAVETHHRNWVALSGEPGLDGVIGMSYRSFEPRDFKRVKDSRRAICKVSLVPLDSIPQVCDKPGCNAWATYHFKVQVTPEGLGHYIWTKTVGEYLHSCPPHARELYQIDHLALGETTFPH